MSQDILRIVSAQFDPHIFDIPYNLAKIEALIERAPAGTDLIVFPEAALTGYCFASLEETVRGAMQRTDPAFLHLQALSKEKHLSIVFGAVEAYEGKCYNSVFFLEPDGQYFVYHKSHLPFLGVDKFVRSGQVGAGVFETRFGKIGLIVCYELRFPETARIAALQGARLILQPTNLPLGGESHPDFLTRARACENRVHFVSSNRIGHERGFDFIGRSQIVDLFGNVLAEADGQEALLCADLDLRPCEDKDIIGTPNERELYLFRDRRTDLYAPLAQSPKQNGFL